MEEITHNTQLTFEFNINGIMHVATTTQSLRGFQMNTTDGVFTTRGVNQIYEISDFPEILRILPVLFRIDCNMDETTCPDEWRWYTAAVFSSEFESTVTSVVDAIQVTASQSCNVTLDVTLQIGESVSFNTTGIGCTISIAKLVIPCQSGKTFTVDQCENCLPGTYKSASGSHPCTFCAEETISGIGAQECSECGTLGRANFQRTECMCEPGSYFETLRWLCTECPAGKSQDLRIRLESCWPCRPGTYSQKGASACIECQENSESNAERSACICKIGYVADGDTCTLITQVVSEERVSVPAGTHWVTFMHYSPSANNSVMQIMNTANVNSWKTGDVVTIIRNGSLTRAMSYTRQVNQWGDIAGFMSEKHTALNVYVIKTAQGVDLSNVAPQIPLQRLDIPVGKTFMAWHSFPELTSIQNLLIRTRDFGTGDRLQIKTATSSIFSPTFTKPALSDAWLDNNALVGYVHTRRNVYSFQIFGTRARALFTPNLILRRLLVAPKPPISHPRRQSGIRRISRQLLQINTSMPPRVYYKNSLTCNTPPECRCKSELTNANINWPGQVCNACVMIGHSQVNCAGNDLFSPNQVQVGFWLNTAQVNGAEVGADSIAVAKLKYTTVDGVPFPEMSIRQWGGPSCVGCRGIAQSIQWISPQTPHACLECLERNKIYFFRLAIMSLATEIRKIHEIASKVALSINFEFDIAGMIYVTRSTAKLSEFSLIQGAVTSVSTSYGVTSDTLRWPLEYVVHKKLFEIDCIGNPTNVFQGDPCPYEGDANVLLNLTADNTAPPAIIRENGFRIQFATGARQFKWTVRKVYRQDANDVFINLKRFFFQTCTSAAIYASWSWQMANGQTIQYSCDPLCREAAGCAPFVYGDYNTQFGYDCEDDIMRWSSLKLVQSDSLIIKKFSYDAIEHDVFSCSSSGTSCFDTTDKTWQLSSQDDRLEIEYNTDGYECVNEPNNIQIRISNTLLAIPQDEIQCVKGYTMTASGICTTCKENEYKDSIGNSRCIFCPFFSTSPTASTKLSDCICNQGYLRSSNDLCIEITQPECQSGFSPDLNGACIACPTSTYKTQAGSALCQSCPDNSISPIASTNASACQCKSGWERSTDTQNLRCIQSECLPGFSPDLNGACIACPTSTYKTQAGSALCQSCPDNSISPIASTNALACQCQSGWEMSTGTQNPQCMAVSTTLPTVCSLGHTLESGKCVACAIGTYKNTESTDLCTLCPDNTITLMSGSTTPANCICRQGYSVDSQMVCESCLAGKFKSLLGDSLCLNCAAGKFSNLIAQFSDTTCQLCAAFSSSMAGSEKCTCMAGAEKKSAGAECTQCAQGFYKIQSGDTLCTPCQSNSNTENEGSTSRATCRCQSELGWSLKADANPSVCEQIIQELGGQFELAVALSDFANNLNNIQTEFTTSLATAFGADPANITLVYYSADSASSLQTQLRRLLQNTSQASQPTSTPATIVDSKIQVFASTPRVAATEVTARLLLAVPGIKIKELQTTPKVIIPGAPATPVPLPVILPVATGATDSNFIQIAVGAGGAALLLFIICLVVLLRSGHQPNHESGRQFNNLYQMDQEYHTNDVQYNNNDMQYNTEDYRADDRRYATDRNNHAYNSVHDNDHH